MFSKLAIFATVALPLLAAATPAAPVAARNDAPPPTTACCASTIPADSAAALPILKLLGIAVQDVTAAIGLTCSPISVVGVGSGSECSGTTVSCSNGLFGSIGVGCVPVTI